MSNADLAEERRPITPEIIDSGSQEVNSTAKGLEYEVISEVNTFFVAATECRPILKDSNRIAKLSFSVGAANADKQTSAKELQFDEDGDPILRRRSKNANASTTLDDRTMLIEYENSTTLSLVGLQVWRGAFVLADFIIHSSIHNPAQFQDKTVLELGSGTGLSSIVAAMYAKSVVATDLNDPNILNLIKANWTHNQVHIKSEFAVKALDFLDLSWSADLEKSVEEADIILAADVVYHERITEAFLQTLKKCLLSGKSKEVFIALEKRYVFTIADLDVVAPAYYFFMEQLESVLGLSLNSFSEKEFAAVSGSSSREEPKPKVSVEPETSILESAEGKTIRLSILPLSLHHQVLPQYFCYERTKDLVLWHIKSELM